MSTITEQINILKLQVNSNLALINGGRKPGYLHSFYGDKVRFGCYVSSTGNKTITFDDSDTLTSNPNAQAPPLLIGEYENMALVYGEVFAISNADATNIILDDTAFPSSGYSRYDIIYIYNGDNGSTIARAEGSSLATPVEPAIPTGAMAVGRVLINNGGIVSITDLRVLGATGTFTTSDSKTVTVDGGFIISIV